MKKTTTLAILVIVVLVSSFIGCGSKDQTITLSAPVREQSLNESLLSEKLKAIKKSDSKLESNCVAFVDGKGHKKVLEAVLTINKLSDAETRVVSEVFDGSEHKVIFRYNDWEVVVIRQYEAVEDISTFQWFFGVINRETFDSRIVEIKDVSEIESLELLIRTALQNQKPAAPAVETAVETPQPAVETPSIETPAETPAVEPAVETPAMEE